jgi:hypothetical protein
MNGNEYLSPYMSRNQISSRGYNPSPSSNSSTTSKSYSSTSSSSSSTFRNSPGIRTTSSSLSNLQEKKLDGMMSEMRKAPASPLRSSYGTGAYTLPSNSYIYSSSTSSPNIYTTSSSNSGSTGYRDELSRTRTPIQTKLERPTRSLDEAERDLSYHPNSSSRPRSPSSPRRSISEGLVSSIASPPPVKKMSSIATYKKQYHTTTVSTPNGTTTTTTSSYSNSCPICSKDFDNEQQFSLHLYGKTDCHAKFKKISEWDDMTKPDQTSNNAYNDNDKEDTYDEEEAEEEQHYDDNKENVHSPVSTSTTPPKKIDSSSESLVHHSIVDREFRPHWRYCSATNEKVMLDNMAIISSRKDQFYFGGKTACTTITTEAAIHLLYKVTLPNNIDDWNEKVIDSIVKTGCMQDPQLGNLSFEEVCRLNKRFKNQLEVLDDGQDTTNSDEPFANTITQIINSAKRNRRDVCAIITKQPETILLFYKYRTSDKRTDYFIAIDSHPRTTDGVAHGAHVIYFLRNENNQFTNVEKYLSKWMFPHIDFEKDSMNEMYNTYAFTIVTAAKDKDGNQLPYSPFLIESLSDNDDQIEEESNKSRKSSINLNDSIQPATAATTATTTTSKNELSNNIKKQLDQLKQINQSLLHENAEKDKKMKEYESMIERITREKNEATTQASEYRAQLFHVYNQVKNLQEGTRTVLHLE